MTPDAMTQSESTSIPETMEQLELSAVSGEPAESELLAAAEAVVFAAGEPIATDRVALALDVPPERARMLLQRLSGEYAYQKRGIRLLQMEDSWQLCSAPEFGERIRKAIEVRKPAKLSQPALEVLTIVAYYQPVTRAYIEQLRGVDSAYTVSLLLGRNLIEPCGRLQAPGRPHLYRTTPQFLRSFHLNSLDDLPDLPDIEGAPSAKDQPS